MIRRSILTDLLGPLFLGGILVVLAITVCGAQKSGKIYSEDLSSYRPRFAMVEDTALTTVNPVQQITVVPTKYVNEKVDFVLDSMDRFNVTKKFVDGFTAQIYSGQKREDAMNTKQKMVEEIPELVANLQYIQPKFRVTVGHYFSKLEAQKDLVRLRRVFPNAIIVPEKIMLR